MFGFLKKKIKEAVDTFTGKAKDDVVESPATEQEIQEAIAKETARKPAIELKKSSSSERETPPHQSERSTPVKNPSPGQKTSKAVSTQKATTQKKDIDQKPAEPIAVKPQKEVQETPVKVEKTTEKTLTDSLEKKDLEPGVKPGVDRDDAPDDERGDERGDEPDDEPDDVRDDASAIETPVDAQVTAEIVDDQVLAPATPENKVAESESDVQEPKPKGLFGKITEQFTKVQLTPERFDELFWDLEITLLENNVAVPVIEKIKTDLRADLTTGKVARKGIEGLIMSSLKNSIESLFVEPFDLIEKICAGKKPYVICFIGVNGAGKTTTLAKMANLFKQNDISSVIAASDTFRAAAIDQLKEHTDKIGIKLISQGYGADPAAVAFDAIEHAKAKGVDVVMIDTAGRLHSNTNLMAELEKVVRVAKPDLKIFIGESTTGNDCVEQASAFDELVGIDAIILSKADVDEKGGAAISVSYVTGHPIIYMGTGQTYGDIEKFDKHRIIKSLGL